VSLDLPGDSTRPRGFFDLLDQAERKALESLARPRAFGAGAILLHERQVGDRVVILLRGRVKVSCVTREGREIVLGFLGPGELIGELSVIDREPRASTVTSLEPVEAFEISAADFRGLIAENPRVSLRLLQMLSHRFRDADRKLIEFGAADTIGRIAARLTELGERYGEASDGRLVITLPISQEELAGWCACSIEAVTKGLHTLRDLGWIETGRRQVTLLDPRAISERAA
jgi:CRP/FNR family transcriptional regulator, cyclic AMP receptor protein